MNWTHDGQRWVLSAAPRYAVGYRSDDDYPMLIDGHEVDSASTCAQAKGILEARYEYNERFADLELARLRLRQVTERLAERFPRASRDPHLASCLADLGDALGQGPEAAEPEATDLAAYTCEVTPDMAVVVDASQCIVLRVSEPHGRLLRTVTVTNVDVLKAALDRARVAQHTALAEADNRRVAGRFDRVRAEGGLDRTEVMDYLATQVRLNRVHAGTVINRVRRSLAPETVCREADLRTYVVSYSGGYWRVTPV